MHIGKKNDDSMRYDIDGVGRTLERSGVEEVPGVAKIRLELALLLEPRLLARVEHRILVVFRVAATRSELRPPSSLFLSELLFERPLLLGRRRCCRRGLVLYLVIGGCLPVAL